MSYYAFMIFLNLHGDPTEVQKLLQPFAVYEDCIIFAQIRAGQQKVERTVVMPVCLQLAAPSGGPAAQK